MARETVATETLAALATSLMVADTTKGTPAGGLRRLRGAAWWQCKRFHETL
jgi:hypothetical protein